MRLKRVFELCAFAVKFFKETERHSWAVIIAGYDSTQKTISAPC